MKVDEILVMPRNKRKNDQIEIQMSLFNVKIKMIIA
jgi:hypothetical protein